MTEIIIQEITLKFFKGIREKTITFNPTETTIKADNRVGKTTIFDAFTWVLFGKDSLGKTTFEIKTNDEKGNTIPNVDHEVKAVLFINGRKTTLRKAWRESWVKKRGAETATLDGHTTDCWWDDVPIGVGEYQARVNQILPEEIFRLVTNPLYFNSLKDDQKRFTLLRIAGDIDSMEVAAGRDSFIQMLKDLDGRTIEEYNKMISNKRRQVKDELEQLNPKITYQAEIIPEPLDWKELESRKKKAEDAITKLITDLSSATELSESKTREISEHNAFISSLQQIIDEAVAQENKRLQDIEAEANKELNEKKKQLSDLDLSLRRRLNNLSTAREKRKDIQSTIERLEGEKVLLIQKYNDVRDSVYTGTQTEIICPLYKHACTCETADEHRREDSDRALESFNTNKANNLREINLKGSQITDKIKDYKASLEIAISDEQQAESEYEAIKSQHASLEADIANTKVEKIERITSNTYMNARNEKLVAECYQAAQQIQQHRDAIQTIKDSNGTTETERLRAELQTARQEAESITRSLSVRDDIEAGKKRLAALEEERKKASQELANLERAELTIQQFQVEMAAEIMRRINSKFKMVQFRLFDTQINGGIKETCETLVAGVPYHSINNEARINAGIDIINVLCEIEQIQAPIWVDNRESVNILQPTASQVINLMVSTDKELTIL